MPLVLGACAAPRWFPLIILLPGLLPSGSAVVPRYNLCVCVTGAFQRETNEEITLGSLTRSGGASQLAASRACLGFLMAVILGVSSLSWFEGTFRFFKEKIGKHEHFCTHESSMNHSCLL